MGMIRMIFHEDVIRYVFVMCQWVGIPLHAAVRAWLLSIKVPIL